MDGARTAKELLDELNQWRVRAARGTGKARVSLRDLAAATGIPHNSLSTYLSGASVMPPDVLDAVVIALGAGPEQAREWATAWEVAVAAELRPGGAAAREATTESVAESAVEPGSKQGQGPPAAGPAGAPESVVPRQLPADTSAFTGRDDVLKELDQFAADGDGSAIVVSAVAGAPGVGKTALAVHWAHQVAERFSDGQLYVNLRGYDPGEPLTPGSVLEMFLTALGADAIPQGTDERAARYRSLLSGKRVLILLDNARTAEQIRPLIPGAPGCLVLVTSRDALAGLVVRDGARRVDLARLPDGEGFELLTRILGRERVLSEPAAGRELVRLCAGSPLALRIAAEHVAGNPDVPLAELAAELADGTERWNVLDATGDPFTDVRAVFSWSYRTLSEPAARLFRLLSLNPAPDFGLPAAANLAGLPLSETRRLIGTLIGAHLLERAGAGRYTWHDLLRAYAAELVAQEESDDQRHQAVTRLLDWYRHTADAAMDGSKTSRRRLPEPFPAPPVPGPAFDDPAAARQWLAAECGCVAAVVRFAAAEGWYVHAWHLARTVWRFCYVAGRTDEWFDIVRDGLAAADRLGDDFARGDLQNALGTAHAVNGGFDLAVAEFSRGLPFSVAAGDRKGEALLLGNLGNAHRVLRDFEPASAALRAALEINRELGDRGGEAISRANLAITAGDLGRFREAIDHTVAVLPLLRAEGNQYGEILALGNLSLFWQRMGEHAEALRVAHTEMALAESLGDRRVLADAVNDLGLILAHSPDQWSQAEPVALRALTITREIGDQDGEAMARHILGLVQLKAADPAAARDHHQRALELWAEIGLERSETMARNGLGAACLALGDRQQALTHYRAALHLAENGRNPYEQGIAEYGVATVLSAQGDDEAARASLERALTIFAELEVPEADAVRRRLGESADGPSSSGGFTESESPTGPAM
ncbi:MAG: tetratricopeptide repeat protein [Catenulispora sp.]|nr:tetratricopeptide repeat protein [Catenulispora sp.]